jgi:hypothetical protein
MSYHIFYEKLKGVHNEKRGTGLLHSKLKGSDVQNNCLSRTQTLK